MTAERTTPDLDRIDALIDWAETSHINGDGQWNQDVYFSRAECGTAFCIAGKVVYDEGLTTYSTTLGFEHFATPGETAGKILGLPTHRGHHPLFHACNTIDDLRRIAKDLRNEHEASS